MAEIMICRVTHWTQKLKGYIEKQADLAVNQRYAPQPKYRDGRASRGNEPNLRGKRVVISDRALVQIAGEADSKIRTETGGLFLGHYENGVWNIIEASDPGVNGIFEVAYHESDEVYQNRVCEVISRSYKYPLVFLGMWHRHPGSLDTFSGTDDITNFKHAKDVGNGCISALVNYDPYFRLTFYYVETDENNRVRYTRLDYEIGDEKITNKEMLELKDLSSLKKYLKGAM
jgi:proteasome lid subunit RPN8/RPN11